MSLRDYQQRAIDMLYDWLSKNSGHPCLVMPTGSGKSHVVAALCRDALQNWPETRILMLTHVKELIEQNAEKMRHYWPNAPMGIYSASIGKKQLDEPITFAGIQSIRKCADGIGHIDLIIIDECHLVNHKDEGGYRKLISELQERNPRLRVVGLTATPYRLGHGYITDDPALFDALIEPVSIDELVYKGHLSVLRSKVTKFKIDTSGVKKAGGEFMESALQKAVDNQYNNELAVDETIMLAGDRKAWLFFCTGVDHAHHINDILINRGISSACITGKTSKQERENIIARFKNGEIRALTNANVLTTGFDYPDIDLITMLRPTLSTALYVQMAGRGMRVKSHTDHCMVLDFAGNVLIHGPITNVSPEKKKGEGEGEAPVKACPECDEIVHASAMTCHACGHEFPPQKKKEDKMKLSNSDIMGIDADEEKISDWMWRKHISKASGKTMLACSYYGYGMNGRVIREYFTILHDGYAGQKARRNLMHIMRAIGIGDEMQSDDLDALAYTLNQCMPPSQIKFTVNGKFYNVTERSWS